MPGADSPSILPDDRYDRRLEELTHPSGWRNPTPAPSYHLVVLGGGTAGLVSAMGAASLGARVALVERGYLGGDCLVTGCVPSKGLIRAAAAAREARTAGRFGLHCEVAGMDFAEAMMWVRSRRSRIAPHDSVERFASAGVDVFLGSGRFVGPRQIEVGDSRLRFRRAVIATGSRPRVPPIDGLEDAGYLTNETVFSLTKQPTRLIVIGGGPIGCELAQAFQRLGSEVTLITDDRLLPRDDPHAGELVTKQFRAEGIRVVTGARVLRVQALDTTLPGDGTATDGQSTSAKRVRFVREGEAGNVEGDELLVAVGRRPNVEELCLEAARVTYDLDRGITVDDRLRTSNPRIYAAGDVCSALRFTHAADAQARLVLRNALFFGRARQSALVVPWCTYTDPEVAHVGLPASEAAENGTFRELVVELDSLDRNVVDGNTTGYGRVYYDRKGRIRSATIVGHGAGNLISEVTLAMTHRLTLRHIASTVHPYPTEGELVKRLADAYNRTRLTPTTKRLFEGFFAWFR